jgi:hypothetical protein
MDKEEAIAALLEMKAALAKVQSALVKVSAEPEFLTLLGAAAMVERRLNEKIERLEKLPLP